MDPHCISCVVPVETWELTEEDLRWLLKAVDGEDEFGWTAPTVLEEILASRAQLWRMEGEAEGVVVTTVQFCPRGKYLMVWFLAGKGLIKGAKEIFDSLKEGAKNAGCFAVYGQAKTKAQVEMYVRFFGLKKAGTNMILEI